MPPLKRLLLIPLAVLFLPLAVWFLYEDIRFATLPDDRKVAATAELFNGTANEAAKQEAKAYVATLLKDPDSAKFKSVTSTRSPAGQNVCGVVNGRNEYGAYEGFTPFAVFLPFTQKTRPTIAILDFTKNDEEERDREMFFSVTCSDDKGRSDPGSN